ncbi:hypothetical protein ACFLY6_02725 [Candidatus Dependentiae bacterium]
MKKKFLLSAFISVLCGISLHSASYEHKMFNAHLSEFANGQVKHQETPSKCKLGRLIPNSICTHEKQEIKIMHYCLINGNIFTRNYLNRLIIIKPFGEVFLGDSSENEFTKFITKIPVDKLCKIEESLTTNDQKARLKTRIKLLQESSHSLKESPNVHNNKRSFTFCSIL